MKSIGKNYFLLKLFYLSFNGLLYYFIINTTSSREQAMTNVGIFGANGRMGKKLIEAGIESDVVKISAAFVRSSSSLIGADIGELIGEAKYGVSLISESAESVSDSNVWIDFTLPEALENHINWCVNNKCNLVIGVTGLSEQQKVLIEKAAEKIAIVYATNFSTGVNLMNSLLKTAAQVMGAQSDIEIVESHHRHKKDAPSGTAITMGEYIADGLGVNLADVAEYDRNNIVGERNQGSIGFASLRAGDIVGEHTALFADIGERLEITHKATDRLTFAKGAIRAAAWVSKKQKGLFDMQDVLGF